MKGKPIMFYDGSCPLCRREVAHYRRLDKHNRVLWLDISEPEAPLADYGLTRDRAMQELHVLGSDGQMYTGAAAFAKIWESLPYFRWLARVTKFPGVLKALEIAYRPFARWRLRRQCAAGHCTSG